MRYVLTEEDLVAVEGIVAHAFTDRELLRRALTHASAGPMNGTALATLGDLVHSVWIVRRAFRGVPTSTKADLTWVVNYCRHHGEQELIFRELALDRYVVVGPCFGSEAEITAQMAATAFEALLAAIELDGGPQAAEAFLERVAARSVDARLVPTTAEPLSGGPDGAG